MRKTQSLDAAYFEALYRENPDPWRFQSSDYEAAKYAHTLATVREEPVKRAFELGCSIGVLTHQLASSCDYLVASELSKIALDQARERCAGQDNIEFVLAKNTTDGVRGLFDLMLLSEVVYYWDDRDLAAVASAIRDHTVIGGRLILVHWLGDTDYPRSADDAVGAMHKLIVEHFASVAAFRTSDYRMDIWRRGAVHPTAARSAVLRTM